MYLVSFSRLQYYLHNRNINKQRDLHHLSNINIKICYLYYIKICYLYFITGNPLRKIRNAKIVFFIKPTK
jgi:hypothetical protein